MTRAEIKNVSEQTRARLLEAARELADRLLRESPAVAESHLERWLGHAEEYVKV